MTKLKSTDRAPSLKQLLIEAIKLKNHSSKNFFSRLESSLNKSEELAGIKDEISEVIPKINQEDLVDQGYYIGVYDFRSFLIGASLYDHNEDGLYGKIRDFAFNANELFIATMSNAYYNIPFRDKKHKMSFTKEKVIFFDEIFDKAVFNNDKNNARYALEGKKNCFSSRSKTRKALEEQLKDFDNDFEKRRLPQTLLKLKELYIDNPA